MFVKNSNHYFFGMILVVKAVLLSSCLSLDPNLIPIISGLKLKAIYHSINKSFQ